MSYQYILLTIFAILAYLIIIDKSVATLFVLLFKIMRVQFERVKWLIIYNPGNPFSKYFMWRNAMKIAKEIRKEYQEK